MLVSLKAAAKRALGARMWTMLRLARLGARTRLFRRRIVRHSYGGCPLTVSISDPLARGWYDHDWPELAEIALLRKYQLGGGATVFDLGAHQCVVALMLANAVGPGGKVVAVEANAHNVAAAEKNRRLNHARQLTILHAAVAERSGVVEINRGLNASLDDGSGGWGRVRTPALSLDALSSRYGMPDVVFIDVEGAEGRVLRGGAQTIAHGPDFFVEVHAGCGLERFGDSPESVLADFPPERFIVFLSETDPPQDFSEHKPNAPLPSRRFFAVAVNRAKPRRS